MCPEGESELSGSPFFPTGTRLSDYVKLNGSTTGLSLAKYDFKSCFTRLAYARVKAALEFFMEKLQYSNAKRKAVILLLEHTLAWRRFWISPGTINNASELFVEHLDGLGMGNPKNPKIPKFPK